MGLELIAATCGRLAALQTFNLPRESAAAQLNITVNELKKALNCKACHDVHKGK